MTYGDLNVTLKFINNKEIKYFYIPIQTDLDGFLKYFLKFTHYDPECFEFISNKVKITKDKAIYYTADNPLKDFVIQCKQKEDLQKVDICFTTEAENFELSFFFSKLNDSANICKTVASYLSLQPEEINIEKKGTKFTVSSQYLLISKATMSPDKEITLVYSKKSTVLDLKFLASCYDKDNCCVLKYNDRIQKNKTVVSNLLAKSTKIVISFQPFINEFKYKENQDSEPKIAQFKGSPIGRNYMRAIAKATRQSLDEVNRKILVIENRNGIHIGKVKCSKFVKYSDNYFILLDEVPYKFEIHQNKSIVDQEICFDPHFYIGQIRQNLTTLVNFPSAYFIKIKDSKGKIIADEITIEDANEETDKFIIEVDEPSQVEATFTLFNNNDNKVTLTIDAAESVLSVLKTVAEHFQIGLANIRAYYNNHIMYANRKFITYFSDDPVYNVASELYITVKHTFSQEYIFPLDISFEFLADVCREKFHLKNKDFCFMCNSLDGANEDILAYSTWEKDHIFPGTQYVARYRKNKGKNKAKFLLLTKKEYEKNILKKMPTLENPDQLFVVDIILYTREGRVESEVNEKASTKVTEIVKNLLKDTELKGQFGVFFVFNREIKFNSTVFDVQQVFERLYKSDETKVRPKIIALIPPEIYRYKIKGSNEYKMMNVKLSHSLYDLKNKSPKNPQLVTLRYNNYVISDLSQPILLFNPGLPFEMEYIKEVVYKLTYNYNGELKEETVQFDVKTTIYDIVKRSCEFIKKEKEYAKYKPTQIRVSINSTILTKDKEDNSIVKEFGPTGTVEITPLVKVGFTVQGDSFSYINFAKDDKISFIKKTMLRRLEANEEHADYYFLLVNGIAADDNDHLYDYPNGDESCFDIAPIQDTVKINAIFPEFTHEYILWKDIIMYDVKELFGRYYNVDDTDLVELTDLATNTVIDDNDNPNGGQVIQVKYDVDNLEVNEIYSKKIEQYKEANIRNMEDASIPEDSFRCPFTYISEKEYNFDLIIEKTITCIHAKFRIADYLAKLPKDSEEQIDFDDILITINNKEVFSQEILFEKYSIAYKSNKEIRFIIKREALDISEPNLFLTSTRNSFFGSFEVFNAKV